jgi:SnoaL-like domain
MTVEEFLEIREIEQLKYRYMRAVDTHDWDLMRECFMEDAKTWYGNGSYADTGRDNILRFFRTVITPVFVSSHIALHPEITLTGPDTAKGIWRLQDIVHFIGPNPDSKEADIKGGEEMVGAGYYYDEYAKRDGIWRISSTGYVRIFEKVNAPDTREGSHLKTEPSLGLVR